MADEPKIPDTPTPPAAAADKPAGAAPAEPLTAEVSRTDAPGGGASAAPPATPAAAAAPAAAKPAAPRPAAPAAKPPAAKAPAAGGAEHVPKAAAPTGPPDPPPPADKVAPAFVASLQVSIPDAVTQVSR
jgi:hypothetical protein